MTCLSHVRGACVHRNLHGTDGCQILPLNLWRHIKNLISVVKWNSFCGNISGYRNVALLCMAGVPIVSCSLKQWSNVFSIALKFKSCRTGKRTGESFLWRASSLHLCPGWLHHVLDEWPCSTGGTAVVLAPTTLTAMEGIMLPSSRNVSKATKHGINHFFCLPFSTITRVTNT